MSYHNTGTSSSSQQTRTNAQGQIAPAGYHYMPDGSLMSDREHKALYAKKTIKKFDLDLSNIKQSGEERTLTILGDNGAVFYLEIRNEDNKYYNFTTNTFQTSSTKLGNITITNGYYSHNLVFPTVTDADQYDFYLFVLDTEGTKHADYKEIRFADGSIDINSSKGSNSNLLKKVIYQTLDVNITLSAYAGGGVITSTSVNTMDIPTARGKSVATTPISITVSVSSGALSIDRQPTENDIMAFVEETFGAAPVDIPGENIYPTATTAFTGDDINGAITSGSVVRMDNTDLSAVIKVGDKITTPVTTDTIDGAVESGIKVVMDNNVATKMAVGDQVTHNGDRAHFLNTNLVTVAALNPDGDNAKEFSLSEAVAIDDGVTLEFSSKINRSTTTVTVVETSSTATDFTMSQAIQFRDNTPLTFFNRRNYRWPITNIHSLKEGMKVKDSVANGFTDEVTIKEYLDQTTFFENEPGEYKITNVQVPALSTEGVSPTIARNATTNVVTTTQTGNIIFSEQALFSLAGTTARIFSYGVEEINRTSGYDVEFTDLKAELNTVTTLTNGAVSASTTMTVDSNLGIADETTQTVNGIVTASTSVVLDSVAGLGIGQSLYVGSGLVGTPTIIAINETTKTITLSTAQTFADGITLTFPNSIISGIGINPAVVNPYVDTISSLDLTTSVAQTLEDNQTFTFTGAGNIVTITGNIRVNNAGNEDVTIRFDIDKFLTQH